jgi:hypothetical protein
VYPQLSSTMPGVRLPLLPGVVVCLVCGRLPVAGNVCETATTHTWAEGHPTAYLSAKYAEDASVSPPQRTNACEGATWTRW